jgi:hypothetical protein
MNLDDDFDTVDELPAGPRRSIPEADRELLELAARALGAVRVEDVDGEEWVNLHFEDQPTLFGWNPLLHSDDALFVAVRLRLRISIAEGRTSVDKTIACLGGLADEPHGDDANAATLRAITIAAAKIGSSMA